MNPPKNRRTEAFTLVELLIAAVIGAAVISVGVVAFATFAALPGTGGAVNVTLPAGIIDDFYGSDSSFITIGPNPNYFQSAQARRMKDRLAADTSAASAVFCLGRNVSGNPSLRPSALAIGQEDFRQHATPSDFRGFLARIDSGLGDVFPQNQNGALLGTANATIFMVGTLASVGEYSNTLTVPVVYEIDFVPTVEPAGGTVASVRRYSGTNRSVPTDYYHAYYPGEANGSDGFRPLGAFFGRSAADEAGSDPFARAINQPFTFVWWPDPLVSRLGAGNVPAASSVSARANYSNMADRTSLFSVLPAFPPL
jgi:hypothetical protein